MLYYIPGASSRLCCKYPDTDQVDAWCDTCGCIYTGTTRHVLVASLCFISITDPSGHMRNDAGRHQWGYLQATHECNQGTTMSRCRLVTARKHLGLQQATALGTRQAGSHCTSTSATSEAAAAIIDKEEARTGCSSWLALA